MKPKIFIGSSKEALPIARAIQENLEHDADITVWSEDVFELSSNAIDDLIKASEDNNFGIFIFNPDDVVEIRKNKQSAVRDNVIFELGLFIGKLGKEKVFYLVPKNAKDLRLPTDLIGVSPGYYDDNRTDGKLKSALAPFSNQIREKVKSFYYEGLIGFETESQLARKYAVEKPERWQYKLAYELLNPRYRLLSRKLYDLENGLIHDRAEIFMFDDAIIFIGQYLKDHLNLIAILQNMLQVEFEKSFNENNGGTVYTIQNWCDKLSMLGNEFLALECRLLFAELGAELQDTKNSMKGWSKNFMKDLSQFQTIFQKLGNSIVLESHEKMNFTFPQNVQETTDKMRLAIDKRLGV